MPPDQAAGLRRRSARQAPACILCWFDSAESTVKLTQALRLYGATSLLVDTSGRVFSDFPARSLFDWKQQLQRGQLRTLPQSYGDGWHAPGVRADEPALLSVARDYDRLVFDMAADRPDLASMPGAAHAVIEIQANAASMLRAYARLKTLSQSEARSSVTVLGDKAACDRVAAACERFLQPGFAQAIYAVAQEDNAFGALAARMAGAESDRQARCKAENTGTWP
jgi:hypothetical protein